MTRTVDILTVTEGGVDARTDCLSVEEPLEIKLRWTDGGAVRETVAALSMRTPGHDEELAAGFLWGEGIVSRPDQIAAVHVTDENKVCVTLAPGIPVNLGTLERHFYTTSSCGVCGKTSLQALEAMHGPAPAKGRPVVDSHVIHALPDTLRAAQETFNRTGGLHAAALFDSVGHLLCLREDVGRHNALDKVVGAQVLGNTLPLSECILLVSGRASFELMQKTLAAGIPLLAAVGAPSSLAVDLAREYDITLLGFVRGSRFNIYSSPWRIAGLESTTL